MATARPIPLDTLATAAALVVNACVATLWPSTLSPVVATLLYLALLWQLLREKPASWVLLGPFIIVHASVMVSLIAIESGATMKEMGQAGHESTASAIYPFYSLCFLVTAAAVLSWLEPRPPGPGMASAPGRSGGDSPLLAYGPMLIGAAAVAYLLFAGLRSGFPLLSGSDRFEFRRLHADIVTLNLLLLKMVLAAMLGTAGSFAASVRRRTACHAIFSAYLGVSFLYGDKFFVILIAACIYAVPYLLRGDDILKAGARHAPFALAALLAASAVTFFIYSEQGALSVADTLSKLAGRIAGQGQLWFMAVEDAPRWIHFDAEMVRDNVASLFARHGASFAFEHRLASFYFVEKYAPDAMRLSFIHNAGSVTPTMAFEACALVAFGFVGAAAAMLACGAFAGLVAAWLRHAMSSGNPFQVLLPAYVLLQTAVMMNQGTFYNVLSLSALKAYAAFFVLQWGVGQLTRRIARVTAVAPTGVPT